MEVKFTLTEKEVLAESLSGEKTTPEPAPKRKGLLSAFRSPSHSVLKPGAWPRVVVLEDTLPYIKHSPAGFNWGYGGSGPAQAAFACCMAIYPLDVARTPAFYQEFKRKYIAGLENPDTVNDFRSVEFTIDAEQVFKEIGAHIEGQ